MRVLVCERRFTVQNCMNYNLYLYRTSQRRQYFVNAIINVCFSDTVYVILFYFSHVYSVKLTPDAEDEYFTMIIFKISIWFFSHKK